MNKYLDMIGSKMKEIYEKIFYIFIITIFIIVLMVFAQKLYNNIGEGLTNYNNSDNNSNPNIVVVQTYEDNISDANSLTTDNNIAIALTNRLDILYSELSDLFSKSYISTLTVGEVKIGSNDSPYSAVITGSEPNQIIDFSIPIGATGPIGSRGPTGPAGKIGIKGPVGPDGPIGLSCQS
jgi:hypothetical protein